MLGFERIHQQLGGLKIFNESTVDPTPIGSPSRLEPSPNRHIRAEVVEPMPELDPA